MADSAQGANIKRDIQTKAKPSFIEDVLEFRGLLTAQQLSFVKNEAKRRQESVEKILTQMGWVTDEQLAAAKSDVLGVPYVDLSQQPISPEVLAYLPEEVARRFIVIPIAREGETLSVAMSDPLDLQVLEFIEKKSGLAVRPYMATVSSIQRTIATLLLYILMPAGVLKCLGIILISVKGAFTLSNAISRASYS